MEKIYQMEGYRLHLIPTNKFKNLTISLKMQNLLEKETVTKRTLLSFMMIAGTQKLKNTKELSRYLENMYGMKLGTNISTKGQSHIININSVCVNQEYLPGKEDLLTKQVQLLNDVTNHLFQENQLFDETSFQQKKKEYKDKLIANKDDKFTYSLEQLLKEMGKDSVLEIPSSGYLEEVDTITNKDLFEYYQDVLKNDVKDVYVVGDFDDSIVDVFKNNLSYSPNHHQYPTVYTFAGHSQVNYKDEQQEITQAKLNMGYAIDCDYLQEKHYAFNVFNTIFGGSSQSRLFKVVREKHSLCYYVSSSYDAFNGMMVVNAGIESQNYQKTIDLIAEQLNDIQAGHISDEELHLAKVTIKNMLVRSRDEQMTMIAMDYNRHLAHKDESNDEYLEKIMAITKEDVVNVSQKIQLDTIFFLHGGEDCGRDEI